MSIIQFIVKNSTHVVIGIIVGAISVVVMSVGKFYLERKKYPPGPLPLPFLGNFKFFLNKKRHFFLQVTDLEKEYGKIFTIYAGKMPQVVILDPKIGMEALKKHTFAGRADFSKMTQIFYDEPDNSTDVLLSDFTPEWEVLRKVTHSALKKYAVSEKAPIVVSQVCDEVIQEIERKEGSNPFDIKHYISQIILSILSSSTYGQTYHFDDKELEDYIQVLETQNKNINQFIMFMFMPFMRHILRKSFNQLKENFASVRRFSKNKFNQHVESFDRNNIRDITDSLILAKMEAEEEDKDAAKYLYPQNIMNSMNLVFGGGSEATRNTMNWAFLFMANHLEIQKKIRDEIENVIGLQEIPTLKHKAECHYTSAFIAEVLRFRPSNPMGAAHKTTVDSQVGKFVIPKDTIVTFGLYSYMHDKEIWGDPSHFRPERFLDSEGKFISHPNSFYVPFSAGRRSCPGDKFVLIVMFCLLSRFIQKTHGKTIRLENGPGSVDLMGDPKVAFTWVPCEFKIKLSTD